MPIQVRPGQGRKRARKRAGYAERMKQDLRRLQEERDEDHRALRTAVNMSGHLIFNAAGVSGGEAESQVAKGSGKAKGNKGKSKKGGKGGKTGKGHESGD